MPSRFDHRGRLTYPDKSILPPDLLARVENEVDAAERRVTEAEDAVEVAQRKVKPAQLQDADDLKTIIAADKEPGKVVDTHERAALADVARKKAIRNAARAALAEVEPPVVAEIRSRVHEIEEKAADVAHEIGERYRAALREAVRLRDEYMPALENWTDLRREVHAQTGADSWHWSPSAQGSIGRGLYQPGDVLRTLLTEDAIRHVPKPRRFASDAERTAWQSHAERGERISPDDVQHGAPSDQEQRIGDDFAAATDRAGGRSRTVYISNV